MFEHPGFVDKITAIIWLLLIRVRTGTPVEIQDMTYHQIKSIYTYPTTFMFKTIGNLLLNSVFK